MGGTSVVPLPIAALSLFVAGSSNLAIVASYTVLKDATVNIADAYSAEGFDFSGTRAFDSKRAIARCPF